MRKHSQKRILGKLASIQERLGDLLLRAITHRREASGWPSGIKPKTNVYEDKDRIVFALELPGVERKDIDVSLYGDLLTVRGERKLTSEQQKANLRWSECVKGSFVTSFHLPEDADTETLQVEYDNGVLRIEIPKKGSRHKRIPVEPAPSPVLTA
jgi:HSP20 family protein